jgi:hypothetical protein
VARTVADRYRQGPFRLLWSRQAIKYHELKEWYILEKLVQEGSIKWQVLLLGVFHRQGSRGFAEWAGSGCRRSGGATMSIIRNGVPKDFSFVSSDTFKLNDPTSTDQSIQSGDDFAHTISYISKGEYEPEKATYPRFKKSFWEESQYNPSIANTQVPGYEHNAHEKEQTSHWKKKGNVMSLEKRFPEPRPKNETGPTKSSSYSHFFEPGVQYYGRKREINPFATAKAYAKPLDRVNQATLQV